MRALLIGVGGAGCRIVETLTRHDVKSGVKSVRSYVFDSDRQLINGMSIIPPAHRFVLTPIDPVKEVCDKGTDFDVGHLASCFQDSGVDEVDAIFVCAGLGGRMAELVPEFISQLTSSFPDPVFTILTLPARSEGIKISAHASEMLEVIRNVSSASLIFDNETWFARIGVDISLAAHKDGVTTKKTLKELYPELNEDLANRVGLLLRAGEFGVKGVESAEVVLDAGEILNTLTGMDLVAIGYAVEKLPTAWSNFLKKLRVEQYLLDEGHLRTSRIVELAKKAVYEEISVPCDLTSADKALILIAGPSKELSMKGFQTVRKWIDRSIRGLEMRAGDYPVTSMKYVGVIIVLSGIQNVPRITELDEIREIYESEQNKVYAGEEISEVVVPRLTMAADEIIFEETPVALSENQEDVIGAPMKFEEDDDIFEENRVVEQKQDEEDDFCEIAPVTIPQKKTRAETSVTQKKTPPKKKDAQIFVGGARKVENTDTTVPLPKREKKVDKVLSGQVDIGGNDKPREMYGSETKLSAGSRKKPDKPVSDILEGSVSTVKSSQRPKETDGYIRMAGAQRPNDTKERQVQVKSYPRPNDGESPVKMGSSHKPKDDGAAIKIQESKTAKDVNRAIRVTSIPLPKNIDGKIVAKKKIKED